MSHLKTLFITSDLPYPMDVGSAQGTTSVLKSLISFSQVYFVSLLKKDSDYKKKFLEVYKDKLVGYKFVKLKPGINNRSVFNLIKSYLYGLPFTVIRNRSEYLNSYIKNLVQKNKFDFVFIDHDISFQFIESSIGYLKRVGTKIILFEHNAEHVLWLRYAKIQKNLLIKLLSYIEAIRVKNYEYKIINLSDEVIFHTHKDLTYFEKIVGNTQKLHYVNVPGDEKLLNLPRIDFEKTENSILFIGTLSWSPNEDGLLWFVQKVWPFILQKSPDIHFYVIGKGGSNILESNLKNVPNLHYLGYVEDLERYYSKSKVFVAPLRFGSGVKIKIINAMYRGIPVVTTSIGIEGIPVKDGESIYVADSELDFADKVLRLMNSKQVWHRLSTESRKFVSKNYSSEKLQSDLKKILQIKIN